MVVRCVTIIEMSLPPFWTLIEAHGAELLRHAKRLAGEGAAEDVLQDAFLKALRGYPRLQHGDHLRAWLFRITTTTAFDHHAKRKGEVLVESVPESTDDPSYDDGTFDTLIEALSAASRDALRLRFVEDLAYDEMARKLGCSEEAARQRVSSGVRELRRRMS